MVLSITVIALVVSAVVALAGYGSYRVLGPDNAIEQTAEAVIKIETGETVDLSPPPEQPVTKAEQKAKA